MAEAIAELVPRQSVRDLLPQLHALREALPQQVEETAYLLRSPANARRLLDAIDSLKAGHGQERHLAPASIP